MSKSLTKTSLKIIARNSIFDKVKKINKNGRIGKALYATGAVISLIPAPGTGLVGGALQMGAALFDHKMLQQPKDLRDDEDDGKVDWNAVSDDMDVILKDIRQETSIVSKEIDEMKSMIQNVLEISIDLRYKVKKMMNLTHIHDTFADWVGEN